MFKWPVGTLIVNFAAAVPLFKSCRQWITAESGIFPLCKKWRAVIKYTYCSPQMRTNFFQTCAKSRNQPDVIMGKLPVHWKIQQRSSGSSNSNAGPIDWRSRSVPRGSNHPCWRFWPALRRDWPRTWCSRSANRGTPHRLHRSPLTGARGRQTRPTPTPVPQTIFGTFFFLKKKEEKEKFKKY